MRNGSYYYKPGDFTPRAFFNEAGDLVYFKTPVIDLIVKRKEEIRMENLELRISIARGSLA